MVEKRPWGNKIPDATASQRFDMLKFAIANMSQFDLLALNDDRFSIDRTLPKIVEMFQGDELYFIMGADTFLAMNYESWPGLKQLFQHYIVVSERRMITEAVITQHAISLGIAVAVLPNTMLHHASSDVRARIHDKALWLPAPVANYIEENDLYSNNSYSADVSASEK